MFVKRVGVDTPIRLEKNRLEGMHVNSEVHAVPERVLVPLARLSLLVLLVFQAVVGVHQRVNLVPRCPDQGCRTDLGRDGRFPVVETPVDAGLLLLGDIFEPRRGFGGIVDGVVSGELVESFLRGKEQDLDSDAIGGPDHGLDVKDWPAVC